MATWQPNHGTATPNAPVLLRPATVAPVGAAQTDFVLELGDEVQVNPILLHLLAEEFDLRVDADTLLTALPEGGFDPAPLFERLIKESHGVPGFAVTPRRLLGTLSFAKLPMVTDLQTNEAALEAPMSSRPLPVTPEPVSPCRSRPRRSRSPIPTTVRPRRSSWSWTPTHRRATRSTQFWPDSRWSSPGRPAREKPDHRQSGLQPDRHGQSVLFVAEKRAAISAVLSRLDRVGLADLVLDLHHDVRSRRAVAESLAAGLRAASTIGRPDQQALHERLVTRMIRTGGTRSEGLFVVMLACVLRRGEALGLHWSAFDPDTSTSKVTHGGEAGSGARRVGCSYPAGGGCAEDAEVAADAVFDP